MRTCLFPWKNNNYLEDEGLKKTRSGSSLANQVRDCFSASCFIQSSLKPAGPLFSNCNSIMNFRTDQSTINKRQFKTKH